MIERQPCSFFTASSLVVNKTLCISSFTSTSLPVRWLLLRPFDLTLPDHSPYTIYVHILYIFDKFKFLSFRDGDYSLISNQMNKVFTQHFSFPRIGFCQLIAVLKSAWITIYKIHITSLNLKLVIGTDNGTRNSFFLKLKFDSLQAEFPFLIYNQTFNYFPSLFKRNHQFIYDIGTHNYYFLSLFFIILFYNTTSLSLS